MNVVGGFGVTDRMHEMYKPRMDSDDVAAGAEETNAGGDA
jgi:hypothetical protein